MRGAAGAGVGRELAEHDLEVVADQRRQGVAPADGDDGVVLAARGVDRAAGDGDLDLGGVGRRGQQPRRGGRQLGRPATGSPVRREDRRVADVGGQLAQVVDGQLGVRPGPAPVIARPGAGDGRRGWAGRR